MSNIQGQIERIEAIQQRLNGGAIQAVTVAAADLAADIANRVINDGENSEGGKFSAYSTKTVPAYFYFGRSRNAGGEAKVKAANKKKEGVSYKDFRQFNGLGTVKNFSFTNAMWRGFGVKKVEYAPGFYTVTIGGKTKDSEDKIAWMSGQEGSSIIAPNQIEKGRAGISITKFIING